MSDPLLDFEAEVRQRVEAALGKDAPPGGVTLEQPPPGLGDRGFPCFALAKVLRKSPTEIAKDLAGRATRPPSESTWIAKVEAAGGYVNFHCRRDRLAALTLERVHAQGASYGTLASRKSRVILEHTSANPNGPLHVGRARNPVIGDTMARILRKAGYQVETQYYLDDMGRQVALLAWGRRHVSPDTLPTPARAKADHDLVRYYQAANEQAEAHEKVAAEVQDLVRKSEEADPKTLQDFHDAYQPVLEGMMESLRRIGVTFDTFQKESEFVLNGETTKVIQALQKTAYSHQETDGALFLDLSSFGVHGRSQRFVYRRSDGTSLYPTRDVAYHFWKAQRADRLVNVLGEDHKLQSKQVGICLELLGCRVKPEVIFYSFVSLPEGKMSTRRNRVVFLDDLVDEAVERALDEVRKRREGELSEDRMRSIAEAVGIGALRYNVVRVQPEKGIVFKWEEALNFEGASAPFLQYAHTRCASILRKADAKPAPARDASKLLAHPSELELLFQIARLPRVVDEAAEHDAPHFVAAYAQDLAGAWSAFYRDCPVLAADQPALVAARLTVVQAAKTALANALDLLGIPAPEEM